MLNDPPSFNEFEYSANRNPLRGAAMMASKRELIEPHSGDKRYVRRDDKGHFTKEVNVGRSLAADRRAHAKKTVKPGQGDRGDVKRCRWNAHVTFREEAGANGRRDH